MTDADLYARHGQAWRAHQGSYQPKHAGPAAASDTQYAGRHRKDNSS